MGRIKTQRFVFAVRIPFAIGICYAVSDSFTDSVTFAASFRLTGRIACCYSGSCPFGDPGSIPFAGSFSLRGDFGTVAFGFAFGSRDSPDQETTATRTS